MKNNGFREYQSGHRQFLLNEEDESAVRLQEKRTEVQQLAVAQGWTLEDLDEFSREMFGARIVGVEPRYLDVLLNRFRERARQ